MKYKIFIFFTLIFLSFKIFAQDYYVDKAPIGFFIKSSLFTKCLTVDQTDLKNISAKVCSGLNIYQRFNLDKVNGIDVLKSISVNKCLAWSKVTAPVTQGVRFPSAAKDELQLVSCEDATQRPVRIQNSSIVFVEAGGTSRFGQKTEKLMHLTVNNSDKFFILDLTQAAQRFDYSIKSSHFLRPDFYFKTGLKVKPTISVFGDSQSTGFLSRYDRNERPKGGGIIPFVSEIVSIIRSLNFTKNPNEEKWTFPDYSWVNGSRIYNLKTRFSQLYSQDVTVSNFARNAAETTSQNQNGRNLLDQYFLQKNQSSKSADLTIIYIGANDLVGFSPEYMTTSEDFKRHYAFVVNSILYNNPQARIMIGLIPDLTEIYKLKEKNVGDSYGFTECKDVWKKAPELSTVVNPAYAVDLKNRLTELNQILKNIAADANLLYANRVRVVSDTFDTKPSSSSVSLDCFHPNSSSQNQFAEVFWKNSWWGERP